MTLHIAPIETILSQLRVRSLSRSDQVVKKFSVVR
jgi:hypothetical protein